MDPKWEWEFGNYKCNEGSTRLRMSQFVQRISSDHLKIGRSRILDSVPSQFPHGFLVLLNIVNSLLLSSPNGTDGSFQMTPEFESRREKVFQFMAWCSKHTMGLLEEVHFTIGNGRKPKFWKHCWILGVPLQELFPASYCQGTEKNGNLLVSIM